MQVRGLVTGQGITKDRVYNVVFEYDTMYAVRSDNGKVLYRPKWLFEEVGYKTR